MSGENDNDQKRHQALPTCLDKAQQFFAEGNLVLDENDLNKFQINGDMLLPEHRNLRVRFELLANVEDLIKMDIVEKLSRNVLTAKISSTKRSRSSSEKRSCSFSQSQKSRSSKPRSRSESGDRRRNETESLPEQARVKSASGRGISLEDRPRRVSWGKQTTIRRRLEFSSSQSQNDQNSEPQQSTSTLIDGESSSIASLSPITLGSVPTASEATLPEQSNTAQSLDDDANLSESNADSERVKRLRSAIKSGRVQVNRRGRTNVKKGRTTMAEKAGLIFPSLKVGRELKDMTSKRCIKRTMVHLAAILETVTGDLLEIAGEATQEHNRKIIQPRDIKEAVAADSEFEELFRCVHIPLDPPNCDQPN